MPLAHDTTAAMAAVLELVNSAEMPDTLIDTIWLAKFFANHNYNSNLVRDAHQLAAVRAVRPVLRRLLSTDHTTTVMLINKILAEHSAIPRLARHNGLDDHLPLDPPEAPLSVRIAVKTATAVIDLIHAGELSRLSVCAANCEAIILDASRNRSRRYRSITCANRNAATAYRTRKKYRANC